MRGRQFDVEMSSTVDAALLAWPTAHEQREDELGGNADYVPLEDAGWRYVSWLIAAERQAVDRMDHAAKNYEAEYEKWEDERMDGQHETHLEFDLGTNALAVALKAAKCLPFYSCNGGAFGGCHNDSHPVVGFYCRPARLPLIIAAAERAGAGVMNAFAGSVIAYGRNIDVLMAMANELYLKRK